MRVSIDLRVSVKVSSLFPRSGIEPGPPVIAGVLLEGIITWLWLKKRLSEDLRKTSYFLCLVILQSQNI